MIFGERVPEMLQAAEAVGLRITADEVSDAHRRAFISKPTIISLGRYGSESVYPLGTTVQLIEYAKLKQKFGADYHRIGWELWLLGFPVGEQYWRRPLQNASDKLAEIAKLITDAGEIGEPPILSETGVTLLEAVSHKRSQSPAIGVFRRRLRRSDYETALRQIFDIIMGTFKRPSEGGEAKHQAFVLARILGVMPAKKKRRPALAPRLPIMLVDEFEQMLETISKVVCKHLHDPLAPFSNEDIAEGRNELTMLLDVLLSLEQVERSIYGQSSPILNMLGLITRDMGPRRHSYLLLAWLIVRKIPSIAEGAREFLDATYYRRGSYLLPTAA